MDSGSLCGESTSIGRNVKCRRWTWKAMPSKRAAKASVENDLLNQNDRRRSRQLVEESAQLIRDARLLTADMVRLEWETRKLLERCQMERAERLKTKARRKAAAAHSPPSAL